MFIYGNSGLGKTHLLHAIGHYALSLYPRFKVRYVSSDEVFGNDLAFAQKRFHLVHPRVAKGDLTSIR